MRDLQEKIVELKEWNSSEKKIPSSLPIIKIYDITVHSMATMECQDLASRFKENARKNLHMTSKGIFNGQRSISRMNIQFHMPCSRNSKIVLKRRYPRDPR